MPPRRFAIRSGTRHELDRPQRRARLPNGGTAPAGRTPEARPALTGLVSAGRLEDYRNRTAHPSRPRPTRTGSSGPRSRTPEKPPSAPARTPRSTPPRHQVITKDAGMARLPGIRLFYAMLLLDRSSAEASKHPQLHWLKIVAVNIVGERRRKAARGPRSVHQDSTEQGQGPTCHQYIGLCVRPASSM
jgi:hypothetical protein